MLTRVIGPIAAGWRGYPSRFPPGYGLISYSYRYLNSPSNGVYPWRPQWGQSIISRGVSVGGVDSRGSEPWVLGGHGYERASWVMVLHQCGLICLGVSVLVSGGPLPYQRWLCPSRSCPVPQQAACHPGFKQSYCVSCLIPIASLFNPASILFGLVIVYLPGGIIRRWIPSERG